MSRRSLPILLVLLAVIATGVVWLVNTVQVDVAPAAEVAATPPAPDRPEPAAPAPAPALAETPAPSASAPASADIESTATAAAREVVAKDANAVDMSDAWTVEGRVQLPPGTPADEHVQVVASVGNSRLSKIHSRSDLAPDGSFRVSFAKSAEKGQLVLDARYLYLAITHDVTPDTIAKLGRPIVLRPEIGGCIRGHLDVARNALDRTAPLVGTPISLNGYSATDRRDYTNRLQRSTKIDDRLEFEFGGLPPARLYSLHFDAKELVDADLDAQKVEPGRVLSVALPIQLGVRVSGKVLDEKGAPVEGVEIGYQVEFGLGSTGSSSDEKSAADGSFSVPGIKPGKVSLQISRTGYSHLQRDLGPLADGDVRDGIEAVLQRGLAIAGRVVWPDGRPAAAARIDYSFSVEEGSGSMHYFDNRNDSVTAAADGTFEISGLGAQPVALTAQAEVDPAPAADASAPPAGLVAEAAKQVAKEIGAATSGGRKSKNSWKAHQDQVAPGTRDLVLTLDKGATIRGHAVDDVGGKVAAFRVRAVPVDGTQEWERRQHAVNATGKDGEFAIEGLHDGEWDLVGEAKLHAESSSRRVRVPGPDEDLSLVLPRTAKVSGVVVDRGGKPVPDARAAARPADAASRYNPWSRQEKSARCDAEGRFEIEDAPPGPVKIVGSADGMAASAPLPLELTPGQVVTDLTLALRLPGKITGEVLDDEGRPKSGRPVNAHGTEDQIGREATTDAAGRFEIDDLSPDRYWVISRPSEEEAAQMSGSEEDRQALWIKYQKQASVTVAEGETAHVVLGGVPKDGIKLHGVIYAGAARDRTVPNCGLWLWGRNIENATPVSGTSDAQGRYELVVPRAGEYSLSAMDQKRGTTNSTNFTVPADKTEVEHDIVLPGGRIAGRVIGLDGKAAARVQVSCQPEPMTAAFSGDASYGNAASDDAGAFAFDGLNAGTYRLEAGAQDWQNAPPSAAGKCARSGVVLQADGRIEDIELRLLPKCRVEGVVTGPDGQPAAGASVYARDEGGNVMQRWPPTTSDASGKFSIDGLMPGKTTFAARTRKFASVESAPLMVRADETTKVEIELRPGTKLRVIVRASDDRVVGGFTRITDSSGRDVTMMYAFQEPSFFGEGSTGEGQLIGPVPPGRYKLTAANHDRNTASQDVSVSGEEEVVVTIKLGG